MARVLSVQKAEVIVLAPAKLNLTLEVLGQRDDCFHEIRSVIQAINLCDELTMRPGAKLEVKSDREEWTAEKSLVWQAARRLQEGLAAPPGAIIKLKKRTPLLAGLGGDSSDGAATLKGLNRLWEMGITAENLRKMAARLGSDMPFFLDGGTALAEGRGENITPLPPPGQMYAVLVVPAVPRFPGKTAKLYNSLKPGHYTDGKITEDLVKEIKAGKGIDISGLFNTFENVAFTFFPGLDTYRRHMVKMGAANVHLAGSGPTLFSLVKDREQAETLYLGFQQQKMETYLAETLN